MWAEALGWSSEMLVVFLVVCQWPLGGLCCCWHGLLCQLGMTCTQRMALTHSLISTWALPLMSSSTTLQSWMSSSRVFTNCLSVFKLCALVTRVLVSTNVWECLEPSSILSVSLSPSSSWSVLVTLLSSSDPPSSSFCFQLKDQMTHSQWFELHFYFLLWWFNDMCFMHVLNDLCEKHEVKKHQWGADFCQSVTPKPLCLCWNNHKKHDFLMT